MSARERRRMPTVCRTRACRWHGRAWTACSRGARAARPPSWSTSSSGRRGPGPRARPACGGPGGVGLPPQRLTGGVPRLGAGEARRSTARAVSWGKAVHSGCSASRAGLRMLASPGSWGRWLRGMRTCGACVGRCRPAAAPQRGWAAPRPAGAAPMQATRAQELAHDAATWEPAASLTGEAAAAAIAALGRRRALVDEVAERKPAAQVRRPEGGELALCPGRAALCEGALREAWLGSHCVTHRLGRAGSRHEVWALPAMSGQGGSACSSARQGGAVWE